MKRVGEKQTHYRQMASTLGGRGIELQHGHQQHSTAQVGAADNLFSVDKVCNQLSLTEDDLMTIK